MTASPAPNDPASPAPNDPASPARNDPASLAPSDPAVVDGEVDWEKLFAARLLATRARPYLATALFALHPVESRDVPTMAVDRHWRCYVSAAFVERTPLAELASVWVHEVSHLLRDHHGRGDRYAAKHDVDGPGERLRMNIAADCEINDDAFGDGLPVPAGAVNPSRLGLESGRLMEEYLRDFRLGTRTSQWAWLDCGSGADGSVRHWDLGPGGANALSKEERDRVRFRVAQGIQGRPGDAPDGWKRWAEEAFHPPQPWRQLLGAAVRSAVSGAGTGDDYAYARPARRSASLPGVILPSLLRRPPRVCVVIDTSGSVSDAELGSALLEVAAIGRAAGGRRDAVSVISCDAAAGVAVPLCRAESIPLIGGGGTDLRAGFGQALRGNPRPDVVVALTDGQTPWPERQPPCRTVIGLFPRPPRYSEHTGYVPQPPPKWARVVRIG
ncbi:vWA domain-containing protein [Actinoplanes sp. CA-015351]|uniref:vWA domain-containing protein n=1 Tax=Actinoplanes sp. CA-015351 TaxID=3239897 RepID=UPI003D99E3ED